MFAEEHSSNSSRKRQEQARARRRQMKQQQQKKDEQQKKASAAPESTKPASAATVAVNGASDPTALENPNNNESSGGPAASQSNNAPSAVGSTETKPAANSSLASSSSDVVAAALEQRRLRALERAKRDAAFVLQRFIRGCLAYRKLRSSERRALDSRLADLKTLKKILHQNGGDAEAYAPPPATATSLVIQLLFCTAPNPRRAGLAVDSKPEDTQRISNDDIRPPLAELYEIEEEKGTGSCSDASRLAALFTDVLIPGLTSNDENLNPFIPWLATVEGRTRISKLLGLCLYCVAVRRPSESQRSKSDETVLLRFLRIVLASDSTATKTSAFGLANVVEHCRSLLLLPRSPAPHLDLVTNLRSLLLRNTGGSSPIPPESDKVREKCIPLRDRERADGFFQLVLDSISSLDGPASESQVVALRARLLCEIFTVPLLTWKLQSKSIAMIATRKGSGNRRSASCLLMDMVEAFVGVHGMAVISGQIRKVLPSSDVPLVLSPAPPEMCLLAALVQISHLSPTLNAMDPAKLHYDEAALFYNLMAALVDAVPLSTLVSRGSAVEWVTPPGSTSSHLVPIIISSVVTEQCKMLLVDSYVRALFRAAMNDEIIGTEKVLNEKTPQDLKHEKDVADVAGASASSLAAKEAMIDRRKSFWQSSKWARRLTKGVSSLLSGDDSKTSAADFKRQRTASTSSAAAVTNELLSKGDGGTTAVDNFTVNLFFALCRLYGAIMARWGGTGHEDVVNLGSEFQEKSRDAASSATDPLVLALLNVLCFSTGIVRTSWGIVQSNSRVIGELHGVIDAEKRPAPIRSFTIRSRRFSLLEGTEDDNVGAIVLFVFISCLAHILIVTDDVEIHEMEKPLPIHQLRRCIMLLKKLLYRAVCEDDQSSKRVASPVLSNYFGLALINVSSKTMRDLYDRSSRRPMCVPKLWLVEDLLEKEIRRCRSHDNFVALLSTPVLRVCPFLVSFKRRLKLFENIVTTNRIDVQGSNELQTLKPGVVVNITRGRVLEDGLLHMNNLGRSMRERIVVSYLNEAGAKETGIDVGGLFKDFWTDLSNLAFNPNYALFRATEGAGNYLYPNPSSGAAHGGDHITLFEFLGRILGKALYEGITIQPQFAHFFLSFLRGDYNFLHMLPDLSTMDPQLYNNLMFLKTYEGDAADLCLTFTAASDDFGGSKQVPLVPNGAEVEVTNANKHRYIGMLAKYHVCDRVRRQSEAFTRGLWEVVDSSWLRLFNEPELQVLISGAADGKIDIADMKANVRYAGGFTGLDRSVHRFWNIFSSFSSKQQADLLRFVTSCERPPPLGFSSMNPPFTIQRVGIMRDGDKLPSASTCFNILKLPTYSSEKVMRERILYAIESAAGFELT